jgi:hypothetical protein
VGKLGRVRWWDNDHEWEKRMFKCGKKGVRVNDGNKGEWLRVVKWGKGEG